MVRILASLFLLVMSAGHGAAQGDGGSPRSPTPQPQGRVVGAISIGEFTIGNNFLWAWVWRDAPTEYDARTGAHRLCSTQQPIPGGTGTWLPQACTEEAFTDAVAFVTWTQSNGRPQRTIVIHRTNIDDAANYAVRLACANVPYGTPIRVFWGRNSHSPYPAHWDQSLAQWTAANYDAQCQ